MSADISSRLIFPVKLNDTIFSDFSFFNSFLFGKKWLTIIISDIVILFFAYINYVTNSHLLSYICIALSIIAPVGYLLFYKMAVKNQIKKYDLANKPRVFYTVHLNKNGINVENSNENVTYPWNKVYRVFETKKYYFTYITKARCFILPKTCISPCDEAFATKFILKYLPNHRYKLVKYNKL